VTSLVDRLLAIHDGLDAAGLPHAFGGAIALAYCTEEPRGTRDIDVNVFLDASEAAAVLGALPAEVAVTDADVAAALGTGQVRVWWDETPVDVFLDVHEFHRRLPTGVRYVPFSDREIPILACTALAVFKALFDRTKDWADIEAMIEAGALDTEETLGWLVRLMGGDDPRVRRLAGLGH
jgi:hypothetical protein